MLHILIAKDESRVIAISLSLNVLVAYTLNGKESVRVTCKQVPDMLRIKHVLPSVPRTASVSLNIALSQTPSSSLSDDCSFILRENAFTIDN